MSPSNRVLGLVTLGVGVLASFMHHGLYFTPPTGTVLTISASFLPPVLVLVTAVGVVAYVQKSTIDAEYLGRVALWYVGGGLAFGLAGYASLRSNVMADVEFSMIQLSVANWAIGGSFIGLLLGFYDARQSNAVSEARAREENAKRQARRLSVMNRILRHDLRNKLTIVIGYADVLDGGEASKAPGAIKQAAEDLLDIADRIRNLHTVTEEQAPQPVNLADYVRHALDDIRETYPSVQITTALPDHVQAVTYPEIAANIHDLLQNAVVHNDHEESDIVIDVELKYLREDTEYAELVIEDNGPGIQPDEQVILEEGGETQLNHSLGTGLWLTRWVIEESNGDFDFTMAPEGGTRTVMRLPSTS